MVSRDLDLQQRLLVKKPADIAAPPLPSFGPIGVPIRAVRALGVALFPTPDHLLPHADCRLGARADQPVALQLGMGEDLETTQIVLVEILDRVKQVAVEGRHLSVGR